MAREEGPSDRQAVVASPDSPLPGEPLFEEESARESTLPAGSAEATSGPAELASSAVTVKTPPPVEPPAEVSASTSKTETPSAQKERPPIDSPYRGVATGLCATVAMRVGVSPKLIRVIFGAVLVITLVLGIVPGLIVLGVYLLLSQLVTIDPDCVPDKGNGWPAAQPQQDRAAADERPWLKEFVQFIWSGGRPPKPRYVSASHGFVLTGLRRPSGSTSDRPGKYALRMPFGRMLVYEGWLVFLTESRLRPGEVAPLSRVWIVALEQIREYRRWLSLLRISMTAYSVLTTEQRDRMRKTLGNPNSFFVPLSTVTGLRFERYLGRPRIRVLTTEREVMFAPHGICEWHVPSMYRQAASYVGPWQPELNRILADAIAANQERADRPVVTQPATETLEEVS